MDEPLPILLVVALAVGAGCLSGVPLGDPPGASETTARTATGGDCALHHELLDDEGYRTSAERVAYDDLNGTSKEAFRRTLESGGYVAESADEEDLYFRYWDTTTPHVVAYEGENYTLITYSGEGC